MKVVILAGGFGTRLSEETEVRPKPMVEIGGHPILWHIMKQFASQGLREFIVALGYKGDAIKRFFLDYHTISSSMTIHLKTGRVELSDSAHEEDWVVQLVDTGHGTMTGGRLKRLEKMLGDERFMLTYGDGVADIQVPQLMDAHKQNQTVATITAVRPLARFGDILFDGSLVSQFNEKSQTAEGWINGGFMVLEPEIFSYLKGDESILEKDGLERLAAERKLGAYKHEGFWQCMDTLRDKRSLETLWTEGKAPWRNWK